MATSAPARYTPWKEVFAPHTGVPLDPHHITGAVSVTFWALMLVVTLKYVILILHADNHGEGGGLALTALAAQAVKDRPALRHDLLLLGVFGATLFYGDSLITPAISVLGAMEGLELLTPALKPYVVPATVVRRLRHRGHADEDDHDRAHLRRGAQGLAAAGSGGDRRHRMLPGHRRVAGRRPRRQVL